MRPVRLRPLPVVLCAALALPGCARLAETRLNPLNWFGGGRSAMVDDTGPVRPLLPQGGVILAPADTRPLVGQVTAISLERTPTGGILRATGLAATQGWFNAELVPVALDGGTLSYEFRAEAPAGFEVAGTPASRQITVATVLTAAELAAVSQLRVVGAGNARSTGG